MRPTFAKLIVAALAGTVVGLPATPAAAAYPTCNTGYAVTIRLADLVPVKMLLPSAGTNIFCSLREGDRGAAVVILQQQLNNCYDQNIKEDGIYGSQTWQAVANAQTWERVRFHRNVGTDGKYGPQTAASMTFLSDFHSLCMRLDGTIHVP